VGEKLRIGRKIKHGERKERSGREEVAYDRETSKKRSRKKLVNFGAIDSEAKARGSSQPFEGGKKSSTINQG